MAHIQFNEGYSWDNLPPAQVNKVLDRDEVIDKLSRMVADWQDIANDEGKPLNHLYGRVGDLFTDFCDLLGLTPEERITVLGPTVQLSELVM